MAILFDVALGVGCAIAGGLVLRWKKISNYCKAKLCYRSANFRFFNERDSLLDFLEREFFESKHTRTTFSIMTFGGGYPQFRLFDRLRALVAKENTIRILISEKLYNDYRGQETELFGKLQIRLTDEGFDVKVVINEAESLAAYATTLRGDFYEGFITRNKAVARVLKAYFDQVWSRSQAPQVTATPAA